MIPISRRRRPRAGWTLTEMLLALAIAALLAVLALPVYADWIAESQMMNFARDLAGSMNVARSEAIKRGTRVNLCKSANRSTCAAGGDWAQGFVVYVDRDHDGQLDVAESALQVVAPASAGISARGNRPIADYVSYTSLGTARLLNGALQMGTLTVPAAVRKRSMWSSATDAHPKDRGTEHRILRRRGPLP